MPQDILGKSILDFYHPDDLMLMKGVYEILMNSSRVMDGKFLSKPYRFLIRNGCYITLETEWTSTFNPWTRKLEFITGSHSVLRGKLTVLLRMESRKNVQNLKKKMSLCFSLQ